MPVKFDVILAARVMIDGREETITSPALTLEVVPPYRIRIPAEITMRPGGTAEIVGKLLREPNFSSPVTVKAHYLPAKVSCETAEVAAEDEEFRLLCQAESSARPGQYGIELMSSSMLVTRSEEQKPLTMPVLKAQLILSDKGAIQHNPK